MLAGLRASSVLVVEGVAGQGHLPNLLGAVVVQAGLSGASSREVHLMVVHGLVDGRWRVACTLAALLGPAP